MRSLFTRLAALSVVAIAVAGCAGSSGTALPAAGAPNTGGGAGLPISGSNGTGAIRFVHGSPDAGNVDICFDSKVVASNVAYKTISSYSIVTGGVAHSVIVTTTANAGTGAPGGCSVTNTFPALFAGSVSPTSNVRTTVVIAGTVAKKNLQVLTFSAPAAPVVLGTPQIVINHASPSAPATVAAGYFNATTGLGEASLTTALAFKGTFSTSAVPAVGAQTGAGIAFYVATTAAATTPLASLYAGTLPAAPVPSAADANTADSKNTNNLIPFPASDYILNAFAIDAPAGGTSPAIVIGTYDPITYGF
jgi:hypothetical protein